jgi:hypothetical protein
MQIYRRVSLFDLIFAIHPARRAHLEPPIPIGHADLRPLIGKGTKEMRRRAT